MAKVKFDFIVAAIALVHASYNIVRSIKSSLHLPHICYCSFTLASCSVEVILKVCTSCLLAFLSTISSMIVVLGFRGLLLSAGDLLIQRHHLSLLRIKILLSFLGSLSY